MESTIPEGRITVAEARDIIVGTWVVPYGRVKEVTITAVPNVRKFRCAHPGTYGRVITRTLDQPVLIRKRSDPEPQDALV